MALYRQQTKAPLQDGSQPELSSSLSSDTADSRRNTLIAPDRECVPLDEYKYTVNVGEECIR